MATEFFPPLPPGYDYALAGKSNLLVAVHQTAPTLYLDEASMTWRELDRHVSEVHPAPVSSTC